MDSLVVTHPFHPLFDRRLQVCRAVRRGGRLVFVCVTGDGVSLTLPQEWTDRGPRPGEHRIAVDALVELSALVDALSRRCGDAVADVTVVADGPPDRAAERRLEVAGSDRGGLRPEDGGAAGRQHGAVGPASGRQRG
ncbi:DUF5372 family protein [Streptomyces monashensis]|uniref:DUF5372 family protein n=1 Tax=Streptomyces monashensis TaxID=1678012 RepID=UPI0033D0A8CD